LSFELNTCYQNFRLTPSKGGYEIMAEQQHKRSALIEAIGITKEATRGGYDALEPPSLLKKLYTTLIELTEDANKDDG